MNSRRHSSPSFFAAIAAPEDGIPHPMLVHGVGIATIAAACTTAASAVILSVIMLVLCLCMGIIYIFERSEFIQPMRSIIYFVPAAFLACTCGIVLSFFSAGTATRLGMYLPLTAADALVLARIQPDAPFLSPSDALPDAIRLWWLYAVMALPVGLLRELLGNGTFFGIPFFFRLNASGMNLPFAGFLLLGFALAIYVRLSKKLKTEDGHN